MPTPACSATAAIGAPGSATNTARAASRMRRSFRAASARRPLIGVDVVLMVQGYHWNEPFRSAQSARMASITLRPAGEPVATTRRTWKPVSARNVRPRS